MKILIILILSLFGIIGCQNNSNIKQENERIFLEKYTILEIDSCEYVAIEFPGKLGLAHKGNCKNH